MYLLRLYTNLLICIQLFLCSRSSSDAIDTYDEISKLSLKSLKTYLADRGIECRGCLEKSEFVELAFKSQKSPLKLKKVEQSPILQEATAEAAKLSISIHHWASTFSRLDVITALLERGDSIETRDIDGYTMLHRACNMGYLDIVSFLVEKGANIHSIVGDGFFPIHIAAMSGKDSVIKFLLEKGANVGSANVEGYTPFISAAEYGQTSSVELLLNHGADPKVTTRHKSTALHWAVLRGQFNVSAFLVNRNIVPMDAKDQVYMWA